MKKRVVVALGHRALGTTLPEQKIAVKNTAKSIADQLIDRRNTCNAGIKRRFSKRTFYDTVLAYPYSASDPSSFSSLCSAYHRTENY